MVDKTDIWLFIGAYSYKTRKTKEKQMFKIAHTEYF